MGEGMAQMLVDSGVVELRIANRTWSKAVELAEAVGGIPIRLGDLPAALRDADLLLTSTGASTIVLECSDLESIAADRTSALLIVDIAVPRDVDPAARELDGVTLLDMDDLRCFAEAGVDERRREVASVQQVLAEELERFVGVASAREVAPLVAALRDSAEEVRQRELERFGARSRDLDDRERDAVEALTKGILAKLLHEPTVELKEAAGSPRGERLAEALRDLFRL